MPTQNPIIALTAALVLAQPALAQSSIEELSPVEASVLRSSIVDALYRAEPVPGGAVEAANPAQQMRSRAGLWAGNPLTITGMSGNAPIEGSGKL